MSLATLPRSEDVPMKLNRVEKALMNNPVRTFAQRHFEAKLLEQLGGRTVGATVLEVGCGQGAGVELILERFGAAYVDAFDIDPDMVERARRRLAHYGDRVRVTTGDATDIKAKDASYDAVFDFAIIHHVPDWRDAIVEVRRVLRPGGRFFFEEVTSHALSRWSYRTFLDHPEHDRFSAPEFVAELARHGIDARGNSVERFFGDVVFGVGRVEEVDLDSTQPVAAAAAARA